MEELENLEETLNDSIRESLGARSGIRSRGKKEGGMEDEEALLRYIPKDECGMRGGRGLPLCCIGYSIICRCQGAVSLFSHYGFVGWRWRGCVMRFGRWRVQCLLVGVSLYCL